MPRRARHLAESGIYHLMMRGTERKDIFVDEQDKQKIIDVIFEKRNLDCFKLYAYCIMDNHLHLVLRDEKETVAQSVKRIGTSYAYYFNKKYNRIGHLFQDRFRSEPIKDEGQLLAAIRYVHNNPVKAGITDHQQEYKWSSISSYLGKVQNEKVKKDCEEVILMFGNTIDAGLNAILEIPDETETGMFIDYELSVKEMDYLKIKAMVEKRLKDEGIKIEELKSNREVMMKIVSELSAEDGISLRQISRSLDLNRGIIQRVMKAVSKENRP